MFVSIRSQLRLPNLNLFSFFGQMKIIDMKSIFLEAMLSPIYFKQISQTSLTRESPLSINSSLNII